MRIRRIAGGDIAPGAVVDGPVQIEADLSYEVDNMEGLSVRAGENGEAILDIVSDDNQNRLLQRTILLQFALPGGALAAPVAASMTPILPPDLQPLAAEPASASAAATPTTEAASAIVAPAVTPPIPRPRPRLLR